MDIKNDYFDKDRLEDMVGEIIIEQMKMRIVGVLRTA